MAPLVLLSLATNGFAVAMALAMVLLVLWQAHRHAENVLLAVYFLAFGWSSALIFAARLANLLGRDPSWLIVEAFASSIVAAVSFFTLTAYVTDLWRRRSIRTACLLLFLLGTIGIRPSLVAGAMVRFEGYGSSGTAIMHFEPAGWLAFGSFTAMFLAGLLALWRARDQQARRLLPGAAIAVGGFLVGFLVPPLRPLPVPVLASVVGAVCWTRAILRERLFDPLQNLNDSLRDANALAEERNRHLEAEIAQREALIAELDAFAHTVAHDLKNPLAPIVGAAEELAAPDAADVPAAIRADLLAMIARNARRMARIIDEILLLARVRSGDVRLQPLDMGDIVAGAVDRTRVLIHASGIQVEVAEVWPPAAGHAQWVEEVWANYLSNAVKYGARGGRVALGWTRTATGAVRFWVRDDGPGVTSAQRARLFRPFTRLHQGTADGEGLGLSIVLRIVTRLGGEVGVESPTAGGRGSEFWFTLPASEPTAA